MITRFLTSVHARLNPFSPRAKVARSFLAMLPPTARRDGMKVAVELLPRASPEAPSLKLQFRDGKEMDLDLQRLGIRDIEYEVDRHSRALKRKEDLTSG